VVDEDGSIYVPHSGGSITKVDQRGKIQWHFDSWVSGSEVLPPHLLVLPGANLLMSTQGSREHTFHLSSKGEALAGPEWLPWPASISPAGTSKGYNVVCHQYVHDANTVSLRVYGVVKAGEAIWRRDFNIENQSFYASNPVVLENGRAYVFVEKESGSNFLLALGPAGDVLWQTEFAHAETRGVGMAIAATQDGTVFFGTPRIEDIWRVHSPGSLYAVAPDGTILWTANAGQRVDQILIAPGMIVANVLRTKLMALTLDGEELWEYPLAGWESNGVMDSRGVTYMAGVDKNTIRLKAVDSRGRNTWEYDTGQRAESVSYMAIANGIIYLVSDNGKLMAISN